MSRCEPVSKQVCEQVWVLMEVCERFCGRAGGDEMGELLFPEVSSPHSHTDTQMYVSGYVCVWCVCVWLM